MAFRLVFAQAVENHLRHLSRPQRVSVLEAIEKQLTHEPLKETRQRKPLRPNPLAPWELRVQSLRVFYDVHEDAVIILAVGTKVRNRLIIGDQEIAL